MTAFGPIARDVADAGLVLDVMAGVTVYRDPMPPRESLRIAVAARHPVVGGRLSKDCRAALGSVATMLRQAGHIVSRDRPPYPLTPTQFTDRWLAGIAQDAEELDLSKVESRTGAMVKRGIKKQGKIRPASESRFANAMRGWFPRYDVLITPVLASAPIPIGKWSGRGWVSTMLGIARWMGYTSNWNVACAAAIAVPAGVSGDGLPLSVQLIGPAGSERLLLSLAEVVRQLPRWPVAPDPER